MGIIVRQWPLCLAGHRVEKFLHHLKADAGVVTRQSFTNEAVGDVTFAHIGIVHVIDEYVGIDELECLSGHSSRPG